MRSPPGNSRRPARSKLTRAEVSSDLVSGQASARPDPNGADIEMHEALARIDADSTRLQLDRGATQLREVETRHADVNGFAQHVIAVPCSMAVAAAHGGVRPGRTITRCDLYRLRHSEPRTQLRQQIDKVRVDTSDLVVVVVAQ